MIIDEVKTDVLVVGGGGAALRAAVEAARLGVRTRVAVKGKLLASGSTATAISELFAIGAALGFADARDNPEVHFEDTMRGAQGFCNPSLVRVLAYEAPERVLELSNMGVPFDRENGRIRQKASDFATYPRACSAGARTGYFISQALADRARQLGVSFDEDVMVYKFLVDAQGKVAAALAFRKGCEEPFLYRFRAAVLATGGAQELYRFALSDVSMTGDGYAIALDLGLPLVNMEFVQLGTGVVEPVRLALSKPVFSLRPRLLNGNGKDILTGNLPNGVTADDVYQTKVFPFSASNPSKYIDIAVFKNSIAQDTSEFMPVYLDLRESPEIENTIPNTLKALREAGIDPRLSPLRVGILCQCFNGGVLMQDADCTTAIPGLYVAGEVAGGVRGPDRPGGNSLAEGQVFGYRAGRAAALFARESIGASLLHENTVALALAESQELHRSWQGDAALIRFQLKCLMSRYCSIVRDEKGLRLALDAIEDIRHRINGDTHRAADRCSGESSCDPVSALSTRNLVEVARIVLSAALFRRESRGPHFREDYPASTPDMCHAYSIRRAESDRLIIDQVNY